MSTLLQTFYEGWADHQRRLCDRIGELSAEEVRLRTAQGMWAVWQLAAHMAGSRAYWIYDVLGEGDAETRDLFRMSSTTVPDLPLADAGWEDDETAPRTPAELADALDQTWRMLEECLRRWSPEDLTVEMPRHRPSGTTIVSRQWVLWHVIEHDLHHSGEISQILGCHGLRGLDL